MNKVILAIGLIAVVAAWGCESDTGIGGSGGTAGTGGTGGSGGVIGPLTWTTPGQTIVGDDCDFFADEALAFEITIDGSTVIMQDADPESSLEASTDNYSPEQNEVLLTGTTTNDNFPPCIVELEDAFRLLLDDPDVSLADNDTVQVTWDHTEADVSIVAGDCEGEWFVPLPCSGEVTFTLTQEF
jgi:hypothetical protein